jgi:HSP20 family protein
LFDRFFHANPLADSGTGFPAFNLWTDGDGAVLTSELPGVSIEDLDITVAGRHITLKGSRALPEGEAKNERARRERPAGHFERTFRLPYAIESGRVNAKLANGVLEIALPRAESDRPRKVLINGK